MSRDTKILIIGAVFLTAALIYYSQTAAFAWDEGFHLLAAQLIRNRRQPYLDFFFPQTSLNAYWNALWMWAFGDTWRVAHAIAATCTGSSALLLARFVQVRFGIFMAFGSLIAFGFNELVFRFGGVGQAYGFCLLMLVCAFRCAVLARERHEQCWAAGVGFFAGASAAASLLTAPAIPVLMLWLAIYTRSIRMTLVFCCSIALPFLPVLVPMMHAARVVWFQVFEYNASFRAVLWTNGSAASHNLKVYESLLHSPGALALVGLSLIGIVTFRGLPEIMLCAFLAAAMGISTVALLPTFARYFVFLTPFLVILAIAGAERLPPNHRTTGAGSLCVLVIACLGHTLYTERDSYRWNQMEAIARKINDVTAPNSPILADEQIYFLARRMPPSGMEHENSHKPLPLTPEFRAALHIITQLELDRATKTGAFAAVATCADESRVEAVGLLKLYRHSADVGECTVYW